MALELEWNNKDPFFDRDLNNFRLLFEMRAIDVGVILTRATELQGVFDRLGKGSSYGSSTTHHKKLWPRIEGGGGGGCPVLTFAITPELYVDDGQEALEAAVAAKAARRGRRRRGGVPLELGAGEGEPGSGRGGRVNGRGFGRPRKRMENVWLRRLEMLRLTFARRRHSCHGW